MRNNCQRVIKCEISGVIKTFFVHIYHSQSCSRKIFNYLQSGAAVVCFAVLISYVCWWKFLCVVWKIAKLINFESVFSWDESRWRCDWSILIYVLSVHVEYNAIMIKIIVYLVCFFPIYKSRLPVKGK